MMVVLGIIGLSFFVLLLIVIAFVMAVEKSTKKMKEKADFGDKVYVFIGEDRVMAEIINRTNKTFTVELVDEKELTVSIDDAYAIVGYPYGEGQTRLPKINKRKLKKHLKAKK